MNRRLVVITYHFGPSGPVGGLRWWGLTKHLARSGWECHVVSAADLEEHLGPEESLPAGVSFYRHTPGRTLDDRYRELKERMFPAGTGNGSAAAEQKSSPEPGHDPLLDEMTPPPPAGLDALRGELAALVSFPDEARGWLRGAAAEARRVIDRVQPDVVVSSGPPHSGHLVAWAALRGRHFRWLLDLRDPWVEEDLESANVAKSVRRSRWLRRMLLMLERQVMSASDGFVTTTPELGSTLAERHPGTIPYCLTNGVDPDWLPAERGEPYPGLSVAHVGTLYARRDPRPLLRAFRHYLDCDPTAKTDGSCIRFAGAIEAPYRKMIDLAIAELELEPYVEILGLLSRDEALSVLTRSRLAIVLTCDQQHQIPAKLYEPVALRMPTLVLAGRESSTAAAARALHVGFAEPDDVEGIAAFFRRVRNEDAGRVTQARARAIHYDALARDAERILLHDPGSEPPLPRPEWLTS